MVPAGRGAGLTRHGGAPEPVRDLDWSAERGRGFVDATADIWQEVLAGMRERPVASRITAEQVRDAVAIPVPDEPMAEPDVIAYLREVALTWSMYPGHPGFMAYVSGAGTVPDRPRICSRPDST